MNLSMIRHVIAVLWTMSRGMDRLVKAVIRASPFRYSTEGHLVSARCWQRVPQRLTPAIFRVSSIRKRLIAEVTMVLPLPRLV
jgi:hypothetical protein